VEYGTKSLAGTFFNVTVWDYCRAYI